MWLTKTNIAVISIPTLCTFIGFLFGLKYEINERTNTAIQYLVAGVIFSALSTEIVPIITESDVLKHRLSTIMGLILGASLMISSRAVVLHKQLGESEELFITGTVDVTIGGLLIGASTSIVEGFKKFI
jgi:hypothetical protein